MIEAVKCFHCESENVNKAGLTRNKKQRFYCRACRRFFRENPDIKKASADRYCRVSSTTPLPSKGHLILKLRALAQKLERTPTTSDVRNAARNDAGHSLEVYYAAFGSFSEAISRAKLPPRYNQKFDREKLIGELKKLRKKLKRALIGKDVQAARERGEVSSIYHFQRAFGSVPRAIAAAGAGRTPFTKTQIKNYLRNLKTQLGREPFGRDIAERFVSGETPSLKEVLRAFGNLATIKKSYDKVGIKSDLIFDPFGQFSEEPETAFAGLIRLSGRRWHL